MRSLVGRVFKDLLRQPTSLTNLDVIKGQCGVTPRGSVGASPYRAAANRG